MQRLSEIAITPSSNTEPVLPDEQPVTAEEWMTPQVAEAVERALARPVQLTDLSDNGRQELTPPPSENTVRLRKLVSLEIVDRLVIDKRVRAIKDQRMWRALVVSWATHCERWGVRPADVRDLYNCCVDTFEDTHAFNVFDLRRGWHELCRRREAAAERAYNQQVREQRSLVQKGCLRCMDLGYERMYDRDGNYKGIRHGCRHEPVPADREAVYLRDAITQAWWEALQAQQEGRC